MHPTAPCTPWLYPVSSFGSWVDTLGFGNNIVPLLCWRREGDQHGMVVADGQRDIRPLYCANQPAKPVSQSAGLHFFKFKLN